MSNDDDRKAAEARAKDTRDKIASGQKIAQIMADRQAKISQRLLEKAAKEDRKGKK